MFDIGWSELLLIGIIALIAIGPKELPGALRTLGQWMAKIRRMASEFQGQFQEAMREAEIDQLKKEMDDMAAKATDYAQFDPLDDVRRDIENSVGDIPSLDQPSTPGTTTSETQPEDATTSQPPSETTAAASPSPSDSATVSAAPEPAIADAKPETGRAPA
jgi:sec-independent protein translocase protein TatB